MNAIERIKSQLSAAPVVLYMKGTPDFPQCGFSAQTVGALRACKAKFAHVNIFEDPEVREALKILFELAHLPAALCQWRAGRRLRHRHRDVQERRAETAAGRSRRRDRLRARPPLGSGRLRFGRPRVPALRTRLRAGPSRPAAGGSPRTRLETDCRPCRTGLPCARHRRLRNAPSPYPIRARPRASRASAPSGRRRRLRAWPCRSSKRDGTDCV